MTGLYTSRDRDSVRHHAPLRVRSGSSRLSAGRGVSPVAVVRHFRAAAAAVHFAPAAAARSRSIEVEQRAVRRCGALVDQCPAGARQEIGRFACDERERCTHRMLCGPAASQFRVELWCECGQPRPSIQLTQVVRLGRLVAERCPDEPVHGLAQLARVVEIPVVCLGSCGELGRGEPAVEVGRPAQPFDSGAVTVSECREQIERAVARDEAECQVVCVVDRAAHGRYPIDR